LGIGVGRGFGAGLAVVPRGLSVPLGFSRWVEAWFGLSLPLATGAALADD